LNTTKNLNQQTHKSYLNTFCKQGSVVFETLTFEWDELLLVSVIETQTKTEKTLLFFVLPYNKKVSFLLLSPLLKIIVSKS
jgi:hypothetical protein